MRRFCLFLLLAATVVTANPYRVLVDRPGQWEMDWRAGTYVSETHSDGTVSFGLPGLSQSEVPGDLIAPRLQGVLALPASGDWKLDVLEDSSQVVSGSAWQRAPRYDSRSGKLVAAPARNRDGWSESVVDGFRLLRMDFPLVEPVAGGVRLRKHLRLRLTWQGSAGVPSSSPWANIVDNPKGIRSTFSVGARAMASSGTKAILEGPMVEVTVTDADTFSTRADGVVRLTGAALIKAAGLAPGVSFRHIAVYTGISDTAPVAMTDSLVAPELRLIPIQRVDRNGDSLLDSDDEIRFWVRGPNRWKATPGTGIGWLYSINTYTLSRKYLVKLDAVAPSPNLVVGPKGTSPVAFASVSQPVWVGRPTNLRELEIGKDTLTERDLGRSWYWLGKDASGGIELPFTGLALPGKTTDSVLAQVAVVQNTWFKDGASALDSFGIKGGSTWNPYQPSAGIWSGTDLSSGTSAFRMRFRGSRIALAGLQLLYRRDPTRSDSGLIPAPQTGSVDIAVPDGKTCWVVEDGVATRLCSIQSGHLLDSATSDNTWYAYFPKDPRSVAVGLSAWSAPTQKHVVKDFGGKVSAKVLVVAPSAFADLAEEYAVHREDSSYQLRAMPVAIARSEDVYALWGGGQMDPVAIRDCIRWAHAKWGVSHVFFLGGGHSDPRHLLGTSYDVQLPHWEDHSVATDDFFTFLGTGDPVLDGATHVPAVAMGRVPARSLSEGRAWLDKLETFEMPNKANYGPWRNTVVIAADDMQQGKDPDGIDHTNQSESIAGKLLAVRPWIREEKLYMVTYPLNALYLKPEAARDFQALLNRGVVGVNYMGHGGQSVIADENLLDNAAIDRTLTNKERPFLFYAGSCTVGRNDNPLAKGLSEELVVSSGKGAMASVAGTRTTFVDGNRTLSTRFWENVADTTQAKTIGEALMAAKESIGKDRPVAGIYMNQDLYNILGDPAMILLPGGLPVAVQGLPDTIAALAKLNIRGRALGAKQAQVRLELKPGLDTVLPIARGQAAEIFRLSPKQMTAMMATVSGDTLSTILAMPARIPFGDSAILRVYAWDPNSRKDGGQSFSPRVLRGTILGGAVESAGPTISMRPCDSAWSAGVAYSTTAQIHLPFCIEVDLFDSSGISSETGPDEGVVFSVPGIREPWHPDLRQDVDFRHASAQLVIDSTLMPAGQSYPFDVLARDLMGNLSRSRLQVQVLTQTDYSLYEVFNSPNPVREGENTAFYFKLASEPDTNGTVDSRVQASIRIHTISGKLVKVLRTELSKIAQPRPRAVWDLRDSFGNPVANGIYPYTVVLRIPNETATNTTELVRKGVVAISR